LHGLSNAAGPPVCSRRPLATTLILIVLGALLASSLAAAPPPPVARADEPVACRDTDPATGDPLSARRVAPSAIALCEVAWVTATYRAACPEPPLDVVVVLDRSGSMLGRPVEHARVAARALVAALDLPGQAGTRVAVVSHGDPPTLDVGLTGDAVATRGAIDRLDVADANAADNLPGAVDLARRTLEAAREAARASGRPVAIGVMVALSDGGQTFAAPLAIDAAKRAHAAGVLVAPVCVRHRLADCATMREMATAPAYAFEVGEDAGEALRAAFETIAAVARAVMLAELVVEETLPDGLALVPGTTPLVPEIGEGGRKLTWRIPFVPRSGVTVTFAVEPRWTARFNLPAPRAVYRDPGDPQGREVPLKAPEATLVVSGTCGLETPTPAIPNPTPPTPSTPSTPSPEAPPATATRTEAPSPLPPTATSSPTVTPRPRPLFLPLAFRDQCLRRARPADVVLAIDASLSMRSPTSTGRSKLAAAQEGARAFVAGMRPEDRAAVLAFASGVDLVAGLSGDRAALAGAIDRIAVTAGTRIDVALYAAAAELAGPRRRAESRAVIVLLTDGLPTETSAPAVLAAAEAARGAGATVFAIGVGTGVDRDLLARVAGDGRRYFAAGDGEVVVAVYRQIAETIPCGP